ncbi:Na+/H+ antiporter [Polluticoccus soli]|uniref:Na+/H+ antiporter n=1 Tax=Polluticoccus soli TaxID=3034150 RepID=UPI0023E12424|nr:Na+/H+ antiporter [Flavipsychrobacter sp. JY13-12]
MEHYTTILAILGAMIILSALAEQIRVASPILLIVMGIAIGFIPGMNKIEIEPEIIFLLFLPPLLYEAAFNIPIRDFKEHFRTISSMAFGLVFLTTGCIAVVSYYLIPGMTWPLAFVLGAILAATDAVAAMSITKNLDLPHKTRVILEGESLLNDASALVAYRFAVGAVAGTAFIFWKATLTFLVLLAGGAVVGFVMGFLVSRVLRLVKNNSLAILSVLLLSPFIAYIVAEEFEFSGVIAVVVLGLVMSLFSRKNFPELIKNESETIWQLIAFLLNGFIFIMLGLEVPVVVNAIESSMIWQYTGVALLLTITALVVRTVRVFQMRKSLQLAQQHPKFKNRGIDFSETLMLSARESLIISWSGMRGIVSLAIAIALPKTLPNGEVFPLRSEIIFITTLVILFTILGQGVVLPFIVKKSQD